MNILVTNDDGIDAPGLHTLAAAMRELGNVTVLAPERDWSVSGHTKTLNRPLRVRKLTLPDGTPGLTTDGSPSDCVALAFMGLVEEKIDLVLSGINPFHNLGHDVTYSGTVTAAMEATIWHTPGIAISTTFCDEVGYEPTAKIAACIARKVLEHGLPRFTLLNVNIPAVPLEQVRGLKITRQGMRVYQDELVKRMDPQGRPYYWIGGEPPTGIVENGTDVGALDGNWVSVTPLHLDLTAHALVDELRQWDLSLDV